MVGAEPESCKSCSVDLLLEMEADVACSGSKTSARRTIRVVSAAVYTARSHSFRQILPSNPLSKLGDRNDALAHSPTGSTITHWSSRGLDNSSLLFETRFSLCSEHSISDFDPALI